ncbi:hypothetical protein DFH07DRAFT_765192 [Mycena maculata]|uniref:DUF6589 domain-containing protein n=1 Tax=Mycena maculata TaxID=230809 RepID=A0AAD7KAQ6_9AGAR|nr:hypothetical protein DFH07DRAFT_765192 [Mycena maculata]
MAAPPLLEGLDVNPDWKLLILSLEPTPNLNSLEIRCQLVFSLLVFLGLSLREFLFFLFESAIPSVKQRAGIFMSSNQAHSFAPRHLFQLWHERFPKSIPHLHSTIKSCMEELALEESNKVINDPRLKVQLKSCTLDYIRSMLDPGPLPGIFQQDAPYAWDYLTIFTTSPNEYRKKQARKGNNAWKETSVEADEWEETPEQSTDESTELAGETGGFWKEMGFTRNATFALVFVFSIMTFMQNTGTNLFPMILGLFLEIGGTSSRILSTLSNAGACVSITTIERLKKVLSEDVVAHAIGLMQGPGVFIIIFDNINIFLRKSQQRLFNKNSMIHATNAAIISLPHADRVAEDLEAKMKRRGKCAGVTGADILPTDDNEDRMQASFVGLVMTLILAYCLGSSDWENREAMLKAAEEFIKLDRPLPAEKTRKDQMDDINVMERLNYVEELSALWHFALNATHMIMRLHFGDSVFDPGSLAKHKGLLNRTWDAEKPNYANAKALI